MLHRYLLAPLAALLGLAAAPRVAQAQTGAVGIGTTTPDASAALEVRSTSKGLLAPRLSTAQRDAIASPAAGLVIFNTSTNTTNLWDGTQWVAYLTDTGRLPAITFAYTGGPQTYTVPAGITYLRLDLAGAGGASSNTNNAFSRGGRVEALLPVVAGQVFTVVVGGTGSRGGNSTGGEGGYGGGGNGGYGSAIGGPNTNGRGDGGGGASDLRLNGTDLADRVVVAGGGGGNGYGNTIGGSGGDGGRTQADAGIRAGFLNNSGTVAGGGGGGTQFAGGRGGSASGGSADFYPGNAGTLGQGGQGAGELSIPLYRAEEGGGGGGGGGYYGGGGGAAADGQDGSRQGTYGAGGGGGSSYTVATVLNVVHSIGYRNGNGYVTITPTTGISEGLIGYAGPVGPAGPAGPTGATGPAGAGTVAAGPGLSAVVSNGVATIGLGGSALAAPVTIDQAGYAFGLTGGSVGIGTASPGAGLHVSTGEKPSVSTTPGVFVSGGPTGNPNIELRGTNGSAYLDFVNDLSTDFAARVLSNGSGLGFYTGGGSSPRLLIGPAGALTLSSLAGTGLRMVMADASGSLSTQGLPPGDNLGNHTATTNLGLNGNYLSNAPGNANGLRLDNAGNATVSGSLGIGTAATPTQPLVVQAAAGGGLLGLRNSTAEKYNWSLASGGLSLNESSGGTGRLFVQDGGNVGIGTTNPGARLDVAGSANVSGNSTVAGTATVAGSTYVGGSLALRSGTTEKYNWSLTNGGLNLSESNVAAGRIFVQDATGNIGVGTTSPSARLDVQGSGDVGNNNFAFFRNFNNSPNSGYVTNNGSDVSIRASGAIMGTEFYATSDRRLKTVVGPSDNARDLALLGRLRITDYTMRDRVAFGDRAFKKVIAQEVEEVLPQAVTRQTGFLPDVYATATAAQALPGDSLLLLTLPAGLPAGGARAGQRLKLLGDTRTVLATVAQPAAAGCRTLTVRRAQALAGAAVFVYGLEHADVRAVDYEALSMLNVSATQELARQLAALQARAAAAEAKAAQATATLETFEARLRRLEAGGEQARK